jgi:hypothetical protein
VIADPRPSSWLFSIAAKHLAQIEASQGPT